MNPIPMLLHCPMCGKRHVDRGEFATKPHHTHSCQHCGVTWRPAVVHTVGVRFLPGFKDAPDQKMGWWCHRSLVVIDESDVLTIVESALGWPPGTTVCRHCNGRAQYVPLTPGADYRPHPPVAAFTNKPNFSGTTRADLSGGTKLEREELERFVLAFQTAVHRGMISL